MGNGPELEYSSNSLQGLESSSAEQSYGTASERADNALLADYLATRGDSNGGRQDSFFRTSGGGGAESVATAGLAAAKEFAFLNDITPADRNGGRPAPGESKGDGQLPAQSATNEAGDMPNREIFLAGSREGNINGDPSHSGHGTDQKLSKKERFDNGLAGATEKNTLSETEDEKAHVPPGSNELGTQEDQMRGQLAQHAAEAQPQVQPGKIDELLPADSLRGDRNLMDAGHPAGLELQRGGDKAQAAEKGTSVEALTKSALETLNALKTVQDAVKSLGDKEAEKMVNELIDKAVKGAVEGIEKALRADGKVEAIRETDRQNPEDKAYAKGEGPPPCHANIKDEGPELPMALPKRRDLPKEKVRRLAMETSRTKAPELPMALPKRRDLPKAKVLSFVKAGRRTKVP